MKKLQMIQQNSFNGISENILSHKKLGVYLTEQYCISCAYFQQHKGNFGVCKVISNKKPYDGTIKDNACNGYRIHPELIQKRWDVEHPSLIPKVSIFKLIRDGYNEEAKKARHYRHLKNTGEYQWQNKNSEKKYGVQGIPYSQTTIQSKKIKAGYFSHHKNHQIMDYALRLVKKEYSNEDIIKQLYKMFGVKIVSSTIDNWNKKFGLVFTDKKIKTPAIGEWATFAFYTSHNITPEILPNNLIKCVSCNSYNLKKNGFRINTSCPVQIYYCLSCGKKFTARKQQFYKMKSHEQVINRAIELFKMRISTRQISKTLEIEFKVKISNKSITNWIHKFVDNPNFLINGSHRPEVNQNISKGLKLYFKQKGITKLINGENQ